MLGLSSLDDLGSLLLVLPPEAEAMRPLGPRGDERCERRLVAVRILPIQLPLARVVGELRLVHHRDAVGLRADRLAHAAAAAGLEVRVVEALGSDVEAAVRTGEPAERALDALVEVDHGPHGPGRVLLEGRVARWLVAAFDPGDGVL